MNGYYKLVAEQLRSHGYSILRKAALLIKFGLTAPRQ